CIAIPPLQLGCFKILRASSEAGWKCFRAECPIERLAAGVVVELQRIGDAESGGIAMHEFNLISRLKLSFLHDGKVKPGTPARDKRVDDFIVVKLCREFEAGHPRLRDL